MPNPIAFARFYQEFQLAIGHSITPSVLLMTVDNCNFALKAIEKRAGELNIRDVAKKKAPFPPICRPTSTIPMAVLDKWLGKNNKKQ